MKRKIALLLLVIGIQFIAGCAFNGQEINSSGQEEATGEGNEMPPIDDIPTISIIDEIEIVSVCKNEPDAIEIGFICSYTNGQYQEQNIPDVKPIRGNDIILVSAAGICEYFQYDLLIENDVIIISDGKKNIQMKAGTTKVTGDNTEADLPIVPCVVDDDYKIPLEYIANYFGKYVYYEGTNRGFFTMWISDVQLLNFSDVDVPNDQNYYVLDDWPVPYYALKEDGVTARGIKIGDNEEKVIETYGVPHVINGKDGLFRYSYYLPGMPATEIPILYIGINNEIVIYAEIDK